MNKKFYKIFKLINIHKSLIQLYFKDKLIKRFSVKQ